MAKPRPIPDLSADDSYAVAAAKVVAIRAAELGEHSAGVLDVGDVERVHRMRVATRRLRAALEFFEPCFPRKRYRRVLKEVKRLADALGERRDRDVAIARLSELAATAPGADRAGIETLLDVLRREQLEANEALEPLVADERLAALSQRLGELAERARDAAGNRAGSGDRIEPPVPPSAKAVAVAAGNGASAG